jgi:hypothetical protein
MPEHKPTIAVDLDGTLAFYDGWRDRSHIGDPLPGALEGVKALVEAGFKVTVFTCRCSHETHDEFTGGYSVEDSANIVRVWLKQHCFPEEVAVFTGRGKPFAECYLDDRALRVAPHEDALAWPQAILAIREAQQELFVARPLPSLLEAIRQLTEERDALRGEVERLRVDMARCRVSP